MSRVVTLLLLALLPWTGCGSTSNGEGSADASADAAVGPDLAPPPPPPVITDVKLAPNANSTISCIVSWTTDKPATSSVEFGPTTAYALRVTDPTLVTQHTVTVIGMYAQTTYHLRATDIAGDATSPDMTFATGALPANIQVPNVTVTNAGAVQAGWTLASPNSATDGPPVIWMIDSTGQVVWYYQSKVGIGPGLMTLASDNAHVEVGFEPLSATTDAPPFEIDLGGNITWQGPASLTPAPACGTEPGNCFAEGLVHNGWESLPNGHFIAFEATAKGNIWGDNLVELTRSGATVWKWDTFDHLTPPTPSQTMNAIDWLHSNALQIDLANNLAYYNARNLSRVLKIDRATGNVVWSFGGYQGDNLPGADQTFTPLPSDFAPDPASTYPWFAFPHDPHRLSNGDILMFDNGDAARGYSRAIEYAIDETNKTSKIVFEYPKPDAPVSDKWFYPVLGSAQRLDNNDVLIGCGQSGAAPARILEVTNDGQKVWEGVFPNHYPNSTTLMFRAYRIPALAETIATH